MITINGHSLSLQDVKAVARDNAPVSLSSLAIDQIQESHRHLQCILSADQPVYGINTGFGVFSERRIPHEDVERLSRNLILSHAVGVGDPLPDEVVRAAMLVRANTLAKGFSGVRVEIVQTLIDMLNRHVTPVIPSQGSLGSSGDLCPLSHLALVFTTDHDDFEEESGKARLNGQLMSGKQALAAAGIKRIMLGPKEGLALNNGATFSAAIAALNVWDAISILEMAEISLAMSLEALLGCSNAFDPRLQQVRGHHGQIKVAKRVRELIRESTLVDSGNRVQDAYSLRCAPQVQGSAREILSFVNNVVVTELNAATDNPLIFEPGVALSGGNFHGEPIGMMMDFLGIAMAEVSAIAERRIFRLIDGNLNNGLPPMLVDRPEDAGLNSGLMMPQYVAASLVLENQTLACPDSVHSLPTSAEQEDHNANSMTAARHARQIIENTAHVIAIELYSAARALDLRIRARPDLRMGRGTAQMHTRIRSVVPYQAGDAYWEPEILKVKELFFRK